MLRASKWILLSAVWASALTAPSLGQQVGLPPESIWQGTLDLGATSLRVQFQLNRQEDGTYKGNLISLDQGNAIVPLDSVEIESQNLSLSCKKLRLSYSGTFDKSFENLSGTLTQGADIPLDLVKVDLPKDLKHIETWKGTLKAGPREFDFQIRMFRDENDKLHAKLDSFSESIGDLGLDIATADDSSFKFDLPLTKASYEGTFNSDRTQINGKWRQGGGEFDLTFEWVDLLKTRTVTPPKRPQNPQKPYPYRSQDVEFKNTADNVTLSGTLTLPNEKGKYTAAILITGSGGQDRDESLLEHKPFLVLSDHLTRAGFAVLRFDDRGIAKSTGDPAVADTRDFARDVSAAMDFLKAHDEIDPARIGLIGHSEGGLIAPMVATTRDDVAFVVMLAGPGVTGREIVLNQTALIEEADGVSEAIREANREFLTAALELLASDKSNDDIKIALRTRFDQLGEKLPQELRSSWTGAVFESSLVPMLNPWFRFFLAYDPRPALTRVRCPLLALNGSLDLQVDPKLNLPEIRNALSKGTNRDVQVQELSGLNHLFQSAKTGSPSEYRTIEETMSPVALNAISDWLTRRYK